MSDPVSTGPVDPPDQPDVVEPVDAGQDDVDERLSGPATQGAPTGSDSTGAGSTDGGDGEEGSGEQGSGEVEVGGEAVTEPAKVMRVGSMIKQLLEEVRSTDLDTASRERLAETYERSVVELCNALSPDLQEELRTLSLPFDHDEVPSDAELRVAKAQLVGWLEGLFHGIQATLMAQQFAAQQQVQQMRQIPGQTGGPGPRPQGAPQPPQTGTYL
ncbi:proteasome activator [Ilumatobacter sp.]|uniref:proteasome activator n=1 Tax=Ilumatobacter sp. TaxID=1967498 RepID=UPI003B51D25F